MKKTNFTNKIKLKSHSKSNENTRDYSLTYPKIIACGFALLIALGTILLLLPISTKGESISFMDAFFVATSATCVTGLVPFDTFTTWSVFGQIVIICLIQVGGLGFITVLSFIMRLTKKRISLKHKMLLKESVGSLRIGNVKRMVKAVVIATIIIEVCGMLLLSTRMIPLMGLKRGLYVSAFTSISAYCNAGFDLMGGLMPSSSLTMVNDDPVILITISLLIIIGGLGFIVWEDLANNKFRVKNLNVHTKLVLITTGVLLTLGTILFYVFERNNTLADMSFGNKLLNAFFTNVTTRTAGFNSVDTGALSNASKLITIILMFIGGSSGSTAGGIKTSTVAVLFLCVFATIRNKNEVTAFSKRISIENIKKAITIVLINFCEIMVAVILIVLFQSDFHLLDVLFECFSAIGTVGMSCGITPELSTASQLVIIALMYIGRLTSLIFALMFANSKAKVTTQKPKGLVVVG